MNMLLYSRPQRSELDAWNTPGWSADEVLNYMSKVCYLRKKRNIYKDFEAEPSLVGKLPWPSRIRG